MNTPGNLEFSQKDDIDFFAGLDSGVESKSEDMKTRILSLVDKEVRLDQEVTDAKVKLAELEEELKKVRREEIPALLDEMGQEECKLADGRKVTISSKVNGSVKEEFREEWFNWLEQTQNDGIIKTKVVAEFGRGEMEDARKAKEAINEAGFGCSLDRSIHAQTQAAFIREYVARDVEQEGYVPLPQCVDIFEFREAKVAQPKDPAKRKKS